METFRRVEFVPGSKPSSGDFKSSNSNIKRPANGNDKQGNKVQADKGIFPERIVSKYIKWNKVVAVGPGLYNHGNTCFLNSALQCLIHTPPLAQLMMNEGGVIDDVIKGSPNQRMNMLNYLRNIILNAWGQNGSGHGSGFGGNARRAISPVGLVQNIRSIGRHFIPGRQEDAHEFILLLLDNIHESILKLKGVKLSDTKLANTTLISRVFGGVMRNELKCMQCGYCSQTFNHFVDLSLEVGKGVSSVSDAIRAFTRVERLDRGNEWRCDKCKQKVQACKQLKISEAPKVLMLHLKRFNYNGKVNKHIDVSLTEELPCVVSASHDGGVKESVVRVKYNLYGMVVHHGHSSHSGHYVGYVKAPNGQWCEMNDSQVSRCSLNTLLHQQAYILFYTRHTEDLALIAPPAAAAVETAPASNAQKGSEKNAAPTGNNDANVCDVGEVVSEKKLLKKKKQEEAATKAAAEASSKAKPDTDSADGDRRKKELLKKTSDILNQQLNQLFTKGSVDSQSSMVDDDSAEAEEASSGGSTSTQTSDSETEEDDDDDDSNPEYNHYDEEDEDEERAMHQAFFEVSKLRFSGNLQKKFFAPLARVRRSSGMEMGISSNVSDGVDSEAASDDDDEDSFRGRPNRNGRPLLLPIREAMQAMKDKERYAGLRSLLGGLEGGDNDGDRDRDSDSDSGGSDASSSAGDTFASAPSSSDEDEDEDEVATSDESVSSRRGSNSGSDYDAESSDEASTTGANTNQHSNFAKIAGLVGKTKKKATSSAPKAKLSSSSSAVADSSHPVDVKRHLIEDSRRGKDVGTEGFWDFGVVNGVATAPSAPTPSAEESTMIQAAKQRKQEISRAVLRNERAEANKRKVDDWDEMLDMGRMKKVKNKDKEAVGMSFGGDNFFQEAAGSNTTAARADEGRKKHHDRNGAATGAGGGRDNTGSTYHRGVVDDGRDNEQYDNQTRGHNHGGKKNSWHKKPQQGGAGGHKGGFGKNGHSHGSKGGHQGVRHQHQ